MIDAATNISAELDGERIEHVRRIRSEVFAFVLPEENLFDAPCKSLGNVPAGVYSPAVDDGFYVSLRPLKPGSHTLRFHAENSASGPESTQDVTYTLTVVHASVSEHREHRERDRP